MAGTSLGSAYVQIVPSADGIKGSITEALGSEPEQAGKNAGSKIAAFAKKALTAAAVGKFLKDSVMEGARYEQARGGIETLFGAKGAKNVQEYADMVGKTVSDVQSEYTRLKGVEDQMMKNANDAWKTAGISANEYMEQSTSFAASLLQSVGGDQAKAAEAASKAVIAMSDNANKMGTDIESIQNAYQGFAKGNYQMLDNLKLGYGGTKKEMERLLSDAEEISGVHYDIDNLADVYSAISVVQDKLGITGTTAKEASTTISGSFASMKAAASNFMAQLVMGEDLSGAMEGVFESAITFGRNLVKALGNVLLNLPDAIGQLSETILAKLQSLGNDPTIGNTAGEFIKNFILGLLKNLPKLIAAALSLVGYLVGALGQAAAHLIETGATAIANWAGGMWTGFTTSASAVIENIKASISAKFESIKMAIANKAAAAIRAVRTKFAEARTAITQPFEWARDKISGIIERIKGFFSFKVSTPHIPLPHFSISPSGWKVSDLLKGSIPSLGIKWFAEGGILDKPTLFGAGEAGPEAIMPLDKLRDYTAIDYDRLAGALVRALSSVSHTTVVDVDGREVARTTAPYMETELSRIKTRTNRKLGYI